MALVASPPPLPSNPPSDSLGDDILDDEISKVRAEILALAMRRQWLASSLLSSSNLQGRLEKLGAKSQSRGSHNDDRPPAFLKSAVYQSQCDAHRLAYGVTAFRFNDPSPECLILNPLLGIRLDIRNRHGSAEDPYYLFCRRVYFSNDEIRIHRHTLPAFVPVAGYEQTFLPLTDDEGYGGSEHSHESVQTQNLEGLVECVRRDLVSYTLRRDAMDQLREELELAVTSSRHKSLDADLPEDRIDDDDDDDDDDDSAPSGKYGVDEISAENADYLTLRIVWSDGRLGLIKVSVDGKILRAVVLGSDDKRVPGQERILGEGEPPIYELHSRLQKLHQSVQATTQRRQSISPSDASDL